MLVLRKLTLWNISIHQVSPLFMHVCFIPFCDEKKKKNPACLQDSPALWMFRHQIVFTKYLHWSLFSCLSNVRFTSLCFFAKDLQFYKYNILFNIHLYSKLHLLNPCIYTSFPLYLKNDFKRNFDRIYISVNAHNVFFLWLGFCLRSSVII